MSKGLIVTLVLTYGGALVSLFNPFVGLLIYVCFALIKPEALFSGVPHGNYSRIIAIALLGGWLINGFGTWSLGRGRAIVLLLLGYLVWSFVSACAATNTDVAFAFIESLLKIVLPFVAGITLIDSVAKLKQLVWVIVLSQGILAIEFNLSYYDGYNRLMTEGFGGMEEGTNSVNMVAAAPMALFLGFYCARWWQKALTWGLAALMLHVPLFCMSRGGMLALIVAGAVGFLIIPKKPKHYLAMAVVILVALRLAGPSVREEFMTIFADDKARDGSSQGRLELWANCWDSIQKNPIVGVGPKHFPIIAVQYNWPKGKEAHSLWVQQAAELGIPGVTLLVLFYGVTMARVWPMTREKNPVSDPFFRAVGRMLITGLAAFVVASQFITTAGLELPFYMVLIGAGMLKLKFAHEEAAAGQGQQGQSANPLPQMVGWPSGIKPPELLKPAGPGIMYRQVSK